MYVLWNALNQGSGKSLSRSRDAHKTVSDTISNNFCNSIKQIYLLIEFGVCSEPTKIYDYWLKFLIKRIYLGAQSGGCRFDKKPYYRYSGCHSYDVSALNIVLGLHFKFNSELYALKEHHDEYFRQVESEDAAMELAALQENSTDSLPTISWALQNVILSAINKLCHTPHVCSNETWNKWENYVLVSNLFKSIFKLINLTLVFLLKLFLY